MNKVAMIDIAKYMLKKADGRLGDACESFYQARRGLQYAFRMVSDDMFDLAAAKALERAASDYRCALSERLHATAECEGLKRGLLDNGFTEDEITDMLWQAMAEANEAERSK